MTGIATNPTSAASDGATPAGDRSAPNPASPSVSNPSNGGGESGSRTAPARDGKPSTRDSMLATLKKLRDGQTVEEVLRDERDQATTEGQRSDASGAEPEDGQTGAANPGTDAGAAPPGAPGAPGTDGSPGSDEAGSSGTDDAGGKAVGKAKQALKRAKWPDDVIAGLPPQRVLELGTALAAEQAKQDAYSSQLAQARRENEELKQRLSAAPAPNAGNAGATGAAASQNGNGGTPGAQSATGHTGASDGSPPGSTPGTSGAGGGGLVAQGQVDIDSLLEPIRTNAMLGELAEPLSAAFKAQAQQLRSAQERLDARDAADKQREKDLYRQIDRLGFNAARSEVQAAIPELGDPENWQKVMRKAYQLANLKGYETADGEPDFPKLVRDAANLELKTTIETRQKKQRDKRFTTQVEGQPLDVRDDRPQGSGKAAPRDALKHAARRLREGASAADVDRELAVL